MPYFREYHINQGAIVKNGVSGVNTARVIRDDCVMTTHRSRASQSAVYSNNILDIQADPYAYFLNQKSRRDYQAALSARNLRPTGSPDRGHAWKMSKHITRGDLFSTTRTQSGTTTLWSDAFVQGVPSSAQSLDNIHQGSIESPAPYKEAGLSAFAQMAYAKKAPTAAIFDGAQFLGELREGIPFMTPKSIKDTIDSFHVRNYKSGAKSYLAYEFGFAPFVRSLQDMARALIKASGHLEAGGRRVHRKFGLPWENTSESISYSKSGFITSGLNGQSAEFAAYLPQEWKANSLGSGSGTGQTLSVDLRKTRSVRRWFEGEFTLFYPLDFDPTDYISKAKMLIDLKWTPKTLWELSPWSWLVDWNLRIGDSIAANQKAADDLLIMHYGYAMEHAVYTTEMSWRETSRTSTAAQFANLPRKGRILATTGYKTRLRANPFGFNPGGAGALNMKQLSILGALGLTKL